VDEATANLTLANLAVSLQECDDRGHNGAPSQLTATTEQEVIEW
jgi:hypothetical protein